MTLLNTVNYKSVYINNEEIEISISVRELGFVIDNNLTRSEQIDQLSEMQLNYMKHDLHRIHSKMV